ncbi:TPA: hypothetical protein DIC38_01505 [Candidatus Nomurabacteria bacterium]|nr:MAG: hypothetical protein O210_OD1C00001G0432 [Parcubacteria bacterium RAAC4_OD1_1]HCY26337.1 hypothetical protein [Candidatus Nomurabacteria bacterium]
MNKYFKIYFGLFAFIFLFIIGDVASATTGGPSYINDFKYNPKDESVYYTKYDHGGRGCPPELMKISLVDGKVGTVYSCEKGEQFLNAYRNNNYELGISKINEEIMRITSGFKDLSPINLNKDNISIDLEFIKSENFDFDSEYVKNSIFNGTIYQNGKKITEQNISGCNTEQPFTFAGYAIPGFDKKIILLLSTKGDCFEGGYIYESLLVVGGLENLKKEYINYYKGDMPLVPNEGTLTVYVNDDTKNIDSNNQPEPINENTEKDGNKSNIIILTFILIGILAGFFIGRIFKK